MGAGGEQPRGSRGLTPREGPTNRGEVGGRACNASGKTDGGLARRVVGVERSGRFSGENRAVERAPLPEEGNNAANCGLKTTGSRNRISNRILEGVCLR